MQPVPQSLVQQSQSIVGQSLQQGTYLIDALLHTGERSVVYLASHREHTAPLAVKQIQSDQIVPDDVIHEIDQYLQSSTTARESNEVSSDFPVTGNLYTDRFIREVLLLARLSHRSIPTLHDYFYEDGFWYLVMEYIAGESLANYIKECAPLSPCEALSYGLQLCDVLEYLHTRTPPVIFHDLKPQSVIKTSEGRLMVIDFSVARYFKAGQADDTSDAGSLGYAAPEQRQGLAQTDARSDLYSLGVMLREMLTGKRTTGSLEPSEKLLSLHQSQPSLSPVISALVTILTRVEPMYRFQSAHALREAMEEVYAIEEKRAYERFLENPMEDTHIYLTPLELEKLEIIESDHTKYQEDKGAEDNIQFDVIDASLDHRMIDVQSQPFPKVTKKSAHATIAIVQKDRYRIPRPVIGIFFTAIIVLSVMVTLFYQSTLHHIPLSSVAHPTVVPQPSVQSTAISTATPITSPTVASPAPQITWITQPSLPSPEADNTGTSININGTTYIYVTGGYRGSTVLPHYDHSLYRFNTASSSWQTVSTTFPSMVNNAAVSDGQGNIFMTGGYSPDLNSVTFVLYKYSISTSTLKKIIPPSSVHIGFGSSIISDGNDHMYVSQGFMTAGNPGVLAGTGWYQYDTVSGIWQGLASLPVGLGYTNILMVDSNTILLFNGSKDAGQHSPSTAMYEYSISQNSWQKMTMTASVGLSGATISPLNSTTAIIIGGYDATHSQTLNQVWSLDVRTLQWSSLTPLPGGGSVLGAAAGDGSGHIYLERGATNPNQPSVDFLKATISGL